MTDKHRWKILNKMFVIQIQKWFKRIIYHNQVGLIPEIQNFFNIHKSISVIHHINKLKNKPYDYHNRCRKSFRQNSTPVYDKKKKNNSLESGQRWNLPQCNIGHIWLIHSKHHSQWWKAETIIPKRTKQGCPLLPLLLNTVMEVLAMTIREEKEIKKNMNCKGRSKTVTVCRWQDTIHKKS